MLQKHNILIIFTSIILIWLSCKKDIPIDQTNTEAKDALFVFPTLKNFPPPYLNPDNPITLNGIKLGKILFFDSLLSSNQKQSCASCHNPKYSFTDNQNKLSKGTLGTIGFRNSMPLFNLAYQRQFFWDGRVGVLEDLAFHPITASFEMNESVLSIEHKLNQSNKYKQLFKSAFGSEDITFTKVSKALAQYMKSIIAYSEKAFDTSKLTEKEYLGYRVFIEESKGDCFHCHEWSKFMTNFNFENNGLNLATTLDYGRYAVTADVNDAGKFKVPALLNLKYTAPYFHDGRFSTLQQVINFYDTGFTESATLNPNLKKHLNRSTGKPEPRTWTAEDKQNLIIFLESLVDTSILSNKYRP